MNSDNIQHIRSFYEAVNRQNIEALVSHLHDEVCGETVDVKFEGKDAIRQSWTGFWTVYPDFKVDIKNIASNENQVMAEVEFGGHNQSSPEKLVWYRGVWVFTFHDRRIKHWINYFNLPGYSEEQTKKYLGA